METKFTPGPYVVIQRGNAVWNGAQIWAGETHVASVTYKADKPIHQKEADAHLLAASPELFEALKASDRELRHLVMLLEPLERSGALDVPGLATLNGARAAIIKAGDALSKAQGNAQ